MSIGNVNLNLVEVKPSKIHGSGGFASEKGPIIPAGTIIGPYKGKYMNLEERNKVMDGTYIWKINDNRFVDAKDCMKSNPLRFVNGAKTKSQRKKINCRMMNIGKYPSTEKVYYITTKNIKPGEELLIDYGPFYFI
jgi:hypothetical protein